MGCSFSYVPSRAAQSILYTLITEREQQTCDGIAKGSHLLETLQQLRKAGLCVSIRRKLSRDHPV